MKTFFYTLLWFISSISMSIVYRISGKYIHVNGLITCLSLLLQGLCLIRYIKPPSNHFNLFLGTIMTQSMYIYTSNLSLQYVPIYIVVLFKTFVPFLNALLNGTHVNSYVFSSIVLTIGVFLSIFDLNQKIIGYSTIGLFLCFSACFFNVIRFSITKKYIETNQQSSKNIIATTYPIMAFVIFPLNITNITNITHLFEDTQSLFYFGLSTLVCTILGLLLSTGELNVLQKNNVFFTTILEVLKEVLLLVGSGIFSNQLSLINWVGTLLVICGIINFHFENQEIENENFDENENEIEPLLNNKFIV